MTYKNISVAQLEDFLQQAKPLVLDQRDINSYRQAHLPDAMLFNDQLLMQMRKKYRQTPVLVYCYRGNSSRQLSDLLVHLGFADVYNLEGGWQAWQAYQTQATLAVTDKLHKWLEQYGFAPGNLNSSIENGSTPLMQAAMLAERDYLQQLLAAGADINQLNHDANNALWFACISEDVEIIRLLVEHGIDIDNRNVNGATALIYAASAGKLRVVRALIVAGADIHIQTLDGFNALDSAATIEILRYLKTRYRAA